MADVNIPIALPGVAAFELSDDFLNQQLLYGEHPKLTPAISGAAGAEIKRFQAVGLDSSGDIVPATWHATTPIKPIGIAVHAALDGERVLFWTTGNFNLDLIEFDSTFDTDAKKKAAFHGAPTPTAIVLNSRSAG